MKYEDVLEIAEAVSKNKTINRDELVLEYKLSPTHHRKMNEELFIAAGGHLTDDELEYFDVIEVTILDVNFKFIKKE